MKRLLFSTITLLALGAGCLPATPEVFVPKTVEFTGVYTSLDDTKTIAEVSLADGSAWQVGLAENVQPTKSDLSPTTFEELPLGSLVRVSGLVSGERSLLANTFLELNEGNIILTKPSDGTGVTSPVIVEGFARVFENAFSWRVKENGKVIVSGHETARAIDVGYYGPFRFEIFLPRVGSTTLSLEVFDYSARDGREQDLVAATIELPNTATSDAVVYFSNGKFGSNASCSAVFPVTHRIAATSAIARARIYELLRGPSVDEKRQGYSSALPANVQLREFRIDGTTARLDFSPELLELAGSCRVQAAREQIFQTVRQDQAITDVVVTVGGSAGGVFEP